MELLPFRTSTYARNIFMTGTSRLATIDQAYVEEVKAYAAKNYYINDLDYALSKGWISEQEYQETMSLKGSDDPAYRPAR